MVSIRRSWFYSIGIVLYALSIFVIHRSVTQNSLITYVVPLNEKLLLKSTHLTEAHGIVHTPQHHAVANQARKTVNNSQPRQQSQKKPHPANFSNASRSNVMKLLPQYDENQYPFTITTPSMCPPNTKVRLLVFVISSVKNVGIRSAIRKSWGSPAFNGSSGFKLGFMVGVAPNKSLQARLLEESKTHQDIVQVNYTEDYYKISLSSVSILQWVTRNCRSYEYLVKMDDDSFLMMESMYGYLSSLRPRRSVLGRVVRNSGVNRNKHSKWYTSKEVYSKSRYPDFTNGFTYVITSDVVPGMYEAARSSKSVFPLEDVFITGMCRVAAKVSVKMIPQMSRMIVPANVCFYKDAIARHRVTPQVMQKMWNKIERKDFKCKPGKKS